MTDPIRGRRSIVNALYYAIATGLARAVALAREIVAARYFGVTPVMSAFTVAFQIPNLLRALFADSALQGAVVPVLGELLERDKRAEVIQTVSALVVILTVVLGAASVIFVVVAHPIVGLVAPGLNSHGTQTGSLAANLARIMFPVVLLISLSGLAAGALNALGEFSLPAIAPALWNGVILVALFIGVPHTSSKHGIYVYAFGVLIGSAVQLVLLIPRLRALGVHLVRPRLRGNPHVGRILRNMLPVTIALGVMNFSLLLDSFFGSLVSSSAPAAIDKAFRLYQLPQGVFSIAIATVMFPALVRSAARNDLQAIKQRTLTAVRAINFVMLPTAVLLGVLSAPIVHAVYQRGAFDSHATQTTATALRWWALSLPFAGVSSFLWRVLFSLDARGISIALTSTNIAVNVLVAALLYRSLGVAGVVAGTVSGTVVMTLLQGLVLRRRLGGQIGGLGDAKALASMLFGSLVVGIAAYQLFDFTDTGSGAPTLTWVRNLAVTATLCFGLYGVITWVAHVPEARRAASGGRQLLQRR